MLSTVTFKCQITMNVINWGRQFSEMSRSVPKQRCLKIVILSQLSNIVKMKQNCQNLPKKSKQFKLSKLSRIVPRVLIQLMAGHMLPPMACLMFPNQITHLMTRSHIKLTLVWPAKRNTNITVWQDWYLSDYKITF